MKKLFLSLLLLLATGTQAMELISSNGIYYNIYDESQTAIVVHHPDGASNYTGDVVIPSTVVAYNQNSYQVVGIDFAAFQESKITSVEIPGTVSSLSMQAFCDCDNLKKVKLHEGLQNIGNNCFSWSDALEELELPSTVTYLGYYILQSCTSFKKLTCLMETPPTVGQNNLFGLMSMEGMTLRVPEASLEAYKAKAPWSDFGRIISIEGGEWQGYEMTKSTFTGGVEYNYHDVLCVGTLATVEGNNWTYQQPVSEMNGPLVSKATIDGVDCVSIKVKSVNNQIGSLTMIPEFEVFGTVKAVVIKAGGNIGTFEATFDDGKITLEAGKTNTLQEYTIETNSTVTGINRQGQFSLDVTLAEMDNTAPIYIESITVYYENFPEPEEDISTFTGWSSSTMTLTTEEANHDWVVTPGEGTNVGSPYFTSTNSNGVYETCMYFYPTGSATPKLLNLTSTFTADKKVYKIIVRAKQGIKSVYATINGEKVYSRDPKYYDALADYIIDVPEDVDLTGQQVNVSIEATGMFFLQKISLVIKEDDTVFSGTTGDLTWKAELLPGWMYFNGGTYEKYRLRISGTGNMADYQFETDPYTFVACNAGPWKHLEGIVEVVVEEGAKNIGKYALAYLYHVNKVTLPSTLETIDEYGLCNTRFTTLVMPSVKTIGRYALADNYNIKEFLLPEGLTTIDSYAFDNCNKLQTLYIPSTVTSIGKFAFRGTKVVETVTCLANPDNLTWTGFDSADNFKPDHATTFLVKAAYLDGWNTKFAGLNATIEALPDDVINVTDLTGDGEIDTEDAVFLLNAISAGSTTDACDTNGDGKVDIADVIALLKSLAGGK